MDPSPPTRARRTREELEQVARSRREAMVPGENQGPPAKTRDRRDVGGTPGGLGEFVVGSAMALGGALLLLGRMKVRSGFGVLFGWSVGGPALLGLMVGIGFLFFDARSKPGWILSGGSLAVIVASVVLNLRVVFAPTGLLTTIGIFVLFAGGLGLVARSLGDRGGSGGSGSGATPAP